jgi:hypothetical protein
METGEVGLMSLLATKYEAELRAGYELALESARKDLECDIPQARAAARDFLEREAARQAIRAAQPGDYLLSELVLVFRKAPMRTSKAKGRAER